MKLSALYIFSILFISFSCRNKPEKKKGAEKTETKNTKTFAKPPSNFQDTMLIDLTSAVFYHPDSLQLERIKEMEESGIFEATMHEYFSQMRNARMSIKRDWPGVKIVEAVNKQFLLFRGKSTDTLIDLNSKSDPYGLFLFQPGTQPHFTDMMNIDTELGFYFKK